MENQKYKDIINKMFGNWKVLEILEKDKGSKQKFLCECQCENKTRRAVLKDNLLHGLSKSCGRCSLQEVILGARYGNWLVLELRENQKVYCECQCENKTRRDVKIKNLLNKTSGSCGCINKYNLKIHNEQQRKNNVFVEKDGCFECITNDGVFYFDKNDYDVVISTNRCWFVHKTGYVMCKLGGKNIRLHNQLLSPPKGYVVDHIDGNPLNNRRNNLRICTELQNAKNRKTPSNNTSGVKGVNWNSKMDAWHVRIGFNNKRIFLGYFSDLEEAIKVRKDAEQKYFKEYNRVSKQQAFES